MKNYLYRKFSIEINRALVLSKKKFRIWVPPLHYIYWIIKNEFILFYSILVTSVSASYPNNPGSLFGVHIHFKKQMLPPHISQIFSIFCSFLLLLAKHIAWGKFFFFLFPIPHLFTEQQYIYIYIWGSKIWAHDLGPGTTFHQQYVDLGPGTTFHQQYVRGEEITEDRCD